MHQDELCKALDALKDLGYIVNTESKDSDRWVLACDARQTTIEPLLNALLIDRTQPGLAEENLLIDATSISLTQAPVKLEDLFEGRSSLPERSHMVQNTYIVSHGDTQEKKHVESQ